MSSNGNGAKGSWTAIVIVLVRLGDRDDAVLAGERAGEGLRHDVEVEVERVDLDVGQAGLGRERLGDLDVVRDAELEHRLLDGEPVHLHASGGRVSACSAV